MDAKHLARMMRAHATCYCDEAADLIERQAAELAALRAERVSLTDEQRDAAIDAALAERGYPANTRNAARAGWYAALRAHGIKSEGE